MSNTNQPAKKVFDIMRPGKAPAAPTSRPVIVGHKPQVQDGPVGGNTSKVGATEKRPLLNALAKVSIQPPHHKEGQEPSPSAIPVAADEASLPLVPETPTPTAKEPSPQPAPEPQTVAPEPAPSLPPADSQPDVPSSAQEKEPPTPAPTPGSQEPTLPSQDPMANLPQEPIGPKAAPLDEKLLADAAREPDNPNPLTRHGDQVYVSHHKSAFTFARVLLTLLIIIVLAAIITNVLLDAEIITTDLDIPHTNLL